ncbi:MAG: protein jag [Oscillospiraceae bacterium]|nr:protein jag [Oscillospiraceae bacterium]
MRREAIATGDTIEKAFANACEMLGVATTEAECELLEKPTKKTFGIFGGSPAKVRAVVIEKRPAELAAAYVDEVIQAMGVTDGTVKIRYEHETDSELEIDGSNVRMIIGHRGETLDALQYLACLVANTEKNGYHRVTLDVGDYRAKRKETLENLGRKMAQKVLRTGKICSLEPMNPYERRIIHGVIQEIDGVVSWSDGQEQKRHIVVGPEGSDKTRNRSRKPKA